MIFKIKKVKKRDGKIVDFSPDRIRLAIKKAMLSCGPLKNGMLDKIHEEVLRIMERNILMIRKYLLLKTYRT
ncbi:hypothetical protein CO154_00255 [Candidatus Pacearchaeota archaeon CG_4_9_14_3_um_filter_31_7]|nr:MAG: hypothetical protein CO154_00255 [Candidatus Pacearchaeota archaeon CG_4_9_14_3_um_filter_31_7]